MKPLFRFVAALVIVAIASIKTVAADGEVNVYSYRQPQLILPMFEAFTADTGIKVNAVYAKKGMLERLRSEGANSPADLVFTVDIGRLTDLKNAGLTQAVKSPELRENIPAALRDADEHWFGLTARARVIVTAKDRVARDEISTYEGLAKPKWRGRICMRSAKHAYSIALLASLMRAHGNAAAEAWLAGVKTNLARTPQGNDRAQVKAVSEGVCDVAVINHYYLYQMSIDAEQRAWVDAVDVVFPNQNGRGTHMNISGMAMTKHAPNHAEASLLMAFLASAKGQRMYGEVNGEYPVARGVETGKYLRELGEFRRDSVGLGEVASLRSAASKMVDRVGLQ